MRVRCMCVCGGGGVEVPSDVVLPSGGLTEEILNQNGSLALFDGVIRLACANIEGKVGCLAKSAPAVLDTKNNVR